MHRDKILAIESFVVPSPYTSSDSSKGGIQQGDFLKSGTVFNIEIGTETCNISKLFWKCLNPPVQDQPQIMTCIIAVKKNRSAVIQTIFDFIYDWNMNGLKLQRVKAGDSIESLLLSTMISKEAVSLVAIHF